MGSQEVLESSATMDAKISSCNGGMVEHSYNVEESENLGVDLLNDLDSYWEDIADRLTVSRMVSDSVIKGTICAIQQDAAEKIAQKELELTRLKEMLHLNPVSADSDEPIRYATMCHEPKSRKDGYYFNHSNSMVEHDRLTDSLGTLEFAAKQQFIKLKKEIDKIKLSEEIDKSKWPDSTRRKGSGLSDILRNKWNGVDRTLDGLRNTLESIYIQAEHMIGLSKSLLFEWQQEREFQAEIEGMVIKNCIQCLQEEFEQRLWDQNAQSFGHESTNRLEKIKEISMLRQELDAFSKSLYAPESAQLISHGSLEHRKVSGNHASSPSLWEGNGKHDESIIVVPENLDHAQLKHLSKDDLFSYLKSEMTKMKRHYESKEHEMTEEYFSLKREYLKLKERPSSLPVVKDKEIDTLKKKIPEIILKLDGILVENEKLPSYTNNGDCLDNLKDKLNSLRLENHQLKELLMDKKKEIKCLSLQVSDASEKILKHSMAEENLSRRLENLKCIMEDAQIEASISEDIHKFLLKQLVDQMKGFSQELDMEYDIMQGIYEIIFKEAAHNAEFEIEDSIMESIVMQSICAVIFRESFKEAVEKVDTLNMKYINENELRVSLEMQALEKDNALRLNVSEKEKLEQEVLVLKAVIDEKANSVQEVEEALAKEKEKFELASQEIDNLRLQTTQMQILISRYNEESQVVKRALKKLSEKTEMDKGEISRLRGQLEIVNKKLEEAALEKSMILSISQEHQKNLSLVEAREREQRKQMNSTIALIQELSKEVTHFECKATNDIKVNSLRLETLSSELSCLHQKANRLRRTGLLYKHKLERRCSDLQKAEAEVDLLGDEVDTLLSLLEKIYIGLDHYSPILQHYPGIMDILKLVRRELSGESVRSV